MTERGNDFWETLPGKVQAYVDVEVPNELSKLFEVVTTSLIYGQYVAQFGVCTSLSNVETFPRVGSDDVHHCEDLSESDILKSLKPLSDKTLQELVDLVVCDLEDPEAFNSLVASQCSEHLPNLPGLPDIIPASEDVSSLLEGFHEFFMSIFQAPSAAHPSFPDVPDLDTDAEDQGNISSEPDATVQVFNPTQIEVPTPNVCEPAAPAVDPAQSIDETQPMEQTSSGAISGALFRRAPTLAFPMTPGQVSVPPQALSGAEVAYLPASSRLRSDSIVPQHANPRAPIRTASTLSSGPYMSTGQAAMQPPAIPSAPTVDTRSSRPTSHSGALMRPHPHQAYPSTVGLPPARIIGGPRGNSSGQNFNFVPQMNGQNTG